MPYDDEDGPGPTPVEVPKTSVVLSVTGYDADRVITMVAERLAEQADQRVRDAIDSAVTKVVETVAADVCADRVREELERVLAEGWVQTDGYGSPRGPKKTLKDRVGDLLNSSDSYGSSRRWLDEIIRDQVAKTMGKDFVEEMDKAKAAFRRQVDELLSGKIAAGLRDAFGLR